MDPNHLFEEIGFLVKGLDQTDVYTKICMFEAWYDDPSALDERIEYFNSLVRFYQPKNRMKARKVKKVVKLLHKFQEICKKRYASFSNAAYGPVKSGA